MMPSTFPPTDFSRQFSGKNAARPSCAATSSSVSCSMFQSGLLCEKSIRGMLAKAGISYRKTKRAERVPGFDQAPDFIIPSEYNPQIVIEAKLTEDDGTARDKITRVQHLNALSRKANPLVSRNMK